MRKLKILSVLILLMLNLSSIQSQDSYTIYLVRHAEKALTPEDDPGLSEAGQRRAAELARQLVDADVVAGVDAIYATPFRRSTETAKPIADALKLPLRAYDAADTEVFLDELVKEYKGKIVLVIGHSNTVPQMIANLGASKKVPPIAEDEYDNIYVISIPWFGKTKTIRLRFGVPYVADDVPATPVL